MVRSLKRDEAIRLLAEVELSRLSPAERADQLEIMTCEDWESHPQWNSIPPRVREEFARQDEIADPRDPEYDPVLLLWLTSRYAGARNDFLAARLREAGHQVAEVEGKPASLEPCPCCGLRTLGARGCYEICPVCWWEDDGQDNHDASEVLGGPNAGLSLTAARANYLTEGIADPSREDLRELQEPEDKYERGRRFELRENGRVVSESAAGWSSSLD